MNAINLLFGLPHSVTSKCLALRDNAEAIDYFNVQLHYEGFEVILSSSPYVASKKQRFNIQGTKGFFVKQGFALQEQQLKDGLNPNSIEFGREALDISTWSGFKYLLYSVFDCISSGTISVVSTGVSRGGLLCALDITLFIVYILSIRFSF